MDLAGYASSDDNQPKAKAAAPKRKSDTSQPAPGKRLKQLPKLSAGFQTAPIDDPSLHQGRARSRRWIEGDWNAHVFLKLKISARLRSVLNDIVKYAQEELVDSGCPYTIHTLYDAVELDEATQSTSDRSSSGRATQKDLHISLSHPLPLRSHQIPDFLQHLKVQLSSAKHPDVRPFRLGLDCRVVKYRNGIARAAANSSGRIDAASESDQEGFEDEYLEDAAAVVQDGAGNLLENFGNSGVGKGGRAFLALRVRAGHGELERIQSQILDPFLRLLHLPTYHSNPEFHTSFAWVLVPVPSADSPSGTDAVKDPFTDEMLASLQEKFGKAILDAQPKGGWQVDVIGTKIGKAYRDFALSSNMV